MRKIILFFCIIINYQAYALIKYNLKCDSALLSQTIEIAESQIGTLECDCRNRGAVEKYLQLFNAPNGSPYCSAGIYYCFYYACQFLSLDISNIPIPKTMLANNIYTNAKKYGQKTEYSVGIGDLIIWRRNKTIYGHIEMIKSINSKGWVNTIGFNTQIYKNGAKICGVFEHKSNIYHPIGRLAIRGLVGFDTHKGVNTK